MYPRSPARPPAGPVPVCAPALTHAHAARKLLQRAVLHLKHAEVVDADGQADDAKLIQQALERLAVADLLIDAFTTPAPAPSEQRVDHH